MSHTRINHKKCQTSADGFLSLSLSRKIATSAISALALSATLTFTLQAQNPQSTQNTQSTDEEIKRLEKELRLLELRRQINAKKSSDNPADSKLDDFSTTNQSSQDKDYDYDRSGSFIGVELGYGELLSTADTVYGVLKEKDDGFKYGVLLGYNKFFIKYFGIRFYGNFNVIQFNDKTSGDWLYRLNYGANLDMVANFLATDYADLGAFVGVGLGGQTYIFTGETKQYLDYAEANGLEVSYTSFDVGLNVGLRTNIAKHLGIEVAARVPFIKHKMFASYQLQETYSISARLLWNY